MYQQKEKGKSTLFHSTNNGLQNIIVLKNLPKERGLPFVRRVQTNLVWETPKHKSNITSLKSSRSFMDWRSFTATNKLDEKVTRAELLFSGFITEHNLSIATTDHAGSLFREMFPNSKIAAKYICKRTKTTCTNWPCSEG